MVAIISLIQKFEHRFLLLFSVKGVGYSIMVPEIRAFGERVHSILQDTRVFRFSVEKLQMVRGRIVPCTIFI